MRFLEKLLDGAEVTWVPIAELFHLKNGYTPSKSKKEFWEDGKIPWFRMDDIRQNGQILDSSLQKITESAVKRGKLFPENSIIIATSATIGEHALITVPHLANQRFTNLSVKEKYAEKLNIKYLYYYGFLLADWCKKNTTVSSFASVDMAGFRKFRIPIPCPDNPAKSLAIQAEIVRILDAFTAMTTELTTELSARRKQYNYYREQLLTFSDDADVKWKSLGNVAEVRSGQGFPKAYQGQAEGHYPFYKVSDMNLVGNETTMNLANNYIDSAVAKKLGISPVSAGAIIFPKIGAAIATNKKRLLSIPSVYDNNVMGLIPNEKIISSRFLFYWMQMVDLSTLANDSGAIPSIRKSTMELMLVPILPLSEQARIVSILDKFHALTNSISEGLPREIELRRKQYEHYRDQLLDFPKSEKERHD